jgi:putative DNA primase/helicase
MTSPIDAAVSFVERLDRQIHVFRLSNAIENLNPSFWLVREARRSRKWNLLLIVVVIITSVQKRKRNVVFSNIDNRRPLEQSAAKVAAKAREDELLGKLVEMQPGLEFARASKEAADELDVSRRDIEAEVQARREASLAPLYGHWVTEPWPDPADGASLLRDIIRRLKRHVVFRSEDDPLAIALWLMLSWVHDDCAVHSPILVITSAEPESGKSTTLSLLAFLMPRCIATVEISKAPLYRSIKLWQPSFAVDEFDNVLSGASDDNQALRSVINSGHTRNIGVMRCEGDANTPYIFPTFAPKALGMIGRNLPPATISRGIFIQLDRRRSDEAIDRFLHEDDPELGDLRRRLFRWSLDNADALRDAKPTMPEGFINRRADNWRLQLAIAEQAGEDWAEKTRTAAGNIDRMADTSTHGVRLLADIRRILNKEGLIDDNDCILSATLVTRLKEDPEGPWAEWNRGKGLTQNSLAALLGGGGGRGRRGKQGFGIRSQTVHPPGQSHGKGYKRGQFKDAWARYVPAEPPEDDAASQDDE